MTANTENDSVDSDGKQRNPCITTASGGSQGLSEPLLPLSGSWDPNRRLRL